MRGSGIAGRSVFHYTQPVLAHHETRFRPRQTQATDPVGWQGTSTDTATGETGFMLPDIQGTSDERGIEIDQVGVIDVTDGSCPAPGTVLNGDFSAGPIHWTPDSSGTAEVIMLSGDYTGHLFGAAGTCDSPRLDGKISIPLRSTLSNQALRIQFAGSSGMDMRVSLQFGGEWHADDKTGVGSTTWTTQYVCIPSEFQGQVLGLQFESLHPGSCSGPERDFWFDDLVIVSHPGGCP